MSGKGQQQQIDTAIRKAVLTGSATVDVQARTIDHPADNPMIGRIEGGRTQGIRVGPVEA
ncbi:hypothetical protein ABZ752_21620 [Streptomyces roseifaciens]